MPPRWNEYRKVIERNGFQLVRSKKHETWVQYDAKGHVVRQTRASHGNDEIADAGFFRSLLKQCGKTETHFYDVLKRKHSGDASAAESSGPPPDDQSASGAGDG